MATKNDSDDSVDKKSRRTLSLIMTLLSVAGVLWLSIAAIIFATDRADAVKLLFGSVLPLFATWVGMILAFYFSKHNFVAATQAVTEMSRTVTELKN